MSVDLGDALKAGALIYVERTVVNAVDAVVVLRG